MSRAAVPAYVGQDYSACPPGHRFNLYFAVWNAQWGLDKDGAPAAALRSLLSLPLHSAAMLRALVERQHAFAQALPAEQVFIIDAQSTSPFATGLGLEHPIENGFSFLTPYGLPYLAGSGVKGVLRRSAEELRDEGEQGVDDALIEALFGPENTEDARRGALTCWDVLPQFDSMALEIMTPHQSGYFLGDESPHDAGKPVPIPFLALPAGAKFRFVLCFEPSLVLAATRPALADWPKVVTRIATHAFQWLGFGAKTAVGYGAMALDPEIAAQRKREAEKEAKRRQDDEDHARREQELATMSPNDRAMREFLDARADKTQPELATLLAALKRGQWTGEPQVAIAKYVQREMQQARKWKEKSEKKNPQKDHDHQDTLAVMKHLAGQ